MPLKLNYTEEAVDRTKKQHHALRLQCMQERAFLEYECDRDLEVRAAVIQQCSMDFFFFCYYFLWTHDTRESAEEQIMPFILYEYQVDLAKWFIENIFATIGSIRKRNLLIEKSRDMGLTWLLLAIILWLWLFHKGNVLIGSETAAKVDTIGDLSTHIEKLRFMIRRLPHWLLPEEFDADKDMPEFMIRSNHAQITGAPPTPEFSRQGRYTLIFMDEYSVWECADPAFAATTQSTRCRAIVGTPRGPHNHYARLARGEEDVKVHKKRVHWTLHPIKAAGLERDADGKLTSPWYREETENMTQEQIAAELDIKYDTSTNALVFSEFIETHRFPVVPVRGRKILRIWDPGLCFAVLWIQIDEWGRILVLQEYVDQKGAHINDVATQVNLISQERFRGFEFEDCGDPAGARRNNSAQEEPEYTILEKNHSIDVDWEYFSNIYDREKQRIAQIKFKLKEQCTQKHSQMLLIHEAYCPILVKALSEGYRRKINPKTKRVMDAIEEVHPFEDVVDCLGYGLLYRFGLGDKASKSTAPVKIVKGSAQYGRHNTGPKRRSMYGR